MTRGSNTFKEMATDLSNTELELKGVTASTHFSDLALNICDIEDEICTAKDKKQAIEEDRQLEVDARVQKRNSSVLDRKERLKGKAAA
ncbi:hypothetical protein BGZ65_007261 [Modicella reniformis]|uniref:Uncharacterized protein n=1 Tax=Modicella reniformis TaxID=1440133 RepID=A0A9P6M8E8_9FUNG|nr:hypothetical protein BGZ65_007261 [Modicella reniformis]